MNALTTAELAKLPEGQRLSLVMQALEELLPLLPVEHLRALVSKGESVMGKGNPALPSGIPFDKRTRQGRALLDLIDDLAKLDEEYR